MKLQFPASDKYPDGAAIEFTPGIVTVGDDNGLRVEGFHIKSSTGIPKALAFGAVLFTLAQAMMYCAEEIAGKSDDEFLALVKLNTFEDIENEID